MLVLLITRWLLGFVRFSVRGGSPERLFSYSTRAGAYFWDIAGRKNSGACILAGRYRELRPFARKAGCRLRVRERHGLPFLLRKTRNHRGLWAGCAVFAAILYLLSIRIWCIEISGNSAIPTAELETALNGMGLRPGVLRSGVDPRDIERNLMLKFPKISWMSVNTEGNMVEICLKEKKDKPEIPAKDRACNLVAAQTGQITSLQVFEGTAMVHKGEAVMAGQLLVSGVVEHDTGEHTIHHASARVLAETVHTLTAEVPLRRQERQPTGKTAVRRSLHIFSARVPITFSGKPKGSCDVSAEHFQVSLFGTLLPLGVYQERWTEYSPVWVTLTNEQARAQADAQIASRASKMLGQGKVLSARSTDTVRDGRLIRTAILHCEENIAKESEILIK